MLTLVLSAHALAAAKPKARVNDVYAYAVGDRVEVRWTTPVPTAGRVEFGTRRTPEDPSPLRRNTSARRARQVPGYANNHRATLSGIRRWPVRLRIAGKTADGKTFAGESVTVEAPKPPRVTLKPGRVRILIDRGAWSDPEPPITLGVPMPKGALANAKHVRLVHAGKPIPFQASVVSRYFDGRTVKWLRVTFIAPKGATTVTLEYGRPGKSPETPLIVKRSGKTALIQTGAATLNFRPAGGDLRSGKIVLRLPRAILVDDKGESFVSRVEKVVLEENGPVMGVLRVNGHHVARGKKHFAFEQRIYSYARKPYVRLDYTFGNDLVGPPGIERTWSHKMPKMDSIQSLRLQFEGVGSAPVVVGTGKQRCTLKDGQRVFQREDFEWVQEPGKLKGKRLDGIVRVGKAQILIRNFWQQWPKSVARDRSALHMGLCPKLPAKFYANRKDEHKLYFWIRDGLHSFRPGLAKTHTLYLDLSGNAAAESLIRDEPVACCDPLWTEKSGALRGLAVATRNQFAEFDGVMAKGIKRYKAKRDRNREYGLMNFGDWFGERRYNWGNLEYDLHHAFFLQFARTGDGRFFRIAAEMARHQRDVDTRHWARDPCRIGQQWLHCMGHTGSYFPYTWRKMRTYASPGRSDNLGHMWNRGMIEHYLLGGDRRSLDTALLIADWDAGPQTTNYDFYNARQFGWPTNIVMSAWFATGDPFYLNAARIMVRKLLQKAKATGDHGVHYRKLLGGHCRCKIRHHGAASFMVGIQMAAMHMYYQATGDKTVADEIVKAARFVKESMWIAEKAAWRYTSCPKSNVSAFRGWILSEGLGFAANYSKDPELIDLAVRSMTAAWKNLRMYGKSGGSALCNAIPGLHELGRLQGPAFAERRKTIWAGLRNPGRRWLPTLVPNPDFEENIEGWVPHGYRVTRSTEVCHSGSASLRIEGSMAGQNEYVNTAKNTAASPAEIDWLNPGRAYRLTVWLRVDRLGPHTRTPSARIHFRDASGSRSARHTNRYDISRMGTWQKLSCDFTLPRWNTRNYIAVNTNRRGARECSGLLYVDDVSIVPVEKAKADTYEYVRLDAAAARLSESTRMRPGPPGFGAGLTGKGSAEWQFNVRTGGRFRILAKARGSGNIVARLDLRSADSRPIRAPANPGWTRVGLATLKAGTHTAAVRILDDKAWVGRIVLTNDPGGG